MKTLKVLIPMLVLMLISCQHLPVGPYPDIINWLPKESDIVLRLAVQDNMDIAKVLISWAGLKPVETEVLLSRTALLAMGIELEDGGTPRLVKDLPIHLVSIGIWPGNFIGVALGNEWEKSPSSRYRWVRPDNLELMALSNDKIILSRGKMDEMLERQNKGLRNPRISNNIGPGEKTALSIWITKPEIILRSFPMLAANNPNKSPFIDLMELTLERQKDDTFSLSFNIYVTNERLTGALALALRLGLSARLGLSSDPLERALMSQFKVENDSDKVTVFIPSMSLEMLEKFLKNLNLFPDEKP